MVSHGGKGLLIDQEAFGRRCIGIAKKRGFFKISTQDNKELVSADHKIRLGVANSGKALFGYREAHSSGSNGGGGAGGRQDPALGFHPECQGVRKADF
jgi:hypothetical protein